MYQQNGKRTRIARSNADEVYAQPVNSPAELRFSIESDLELPPVVALKPIVDQCPRLCEWDALPPSRCSLLIRETRQLEPVIDVTQKGSIESVARRSTIFVTLVGT